MSDAEIIKALECHRHIGKETCDSCPLQGVGMCSFVLINEVYNRFNRLQAENERLNFVRTRDAQKYNEKISDQAHTNCVLYDLYDKAIKEVKELEGKLKTAKAEAYKECIDLVKKKGVKVGVDEICIFENTLDNLSKELVGE